MRRCWAMLDWEWRYCAVTTRRLTLHRCCSKSPTERTLEEEECLAGSASQSSPGWRWTGSRSWWGTGSGVLLARPILRCWNWSWSEKSLEALESSPSRIRRQKLSQVWCQCQCCCGHSTILIWNKNQNYKNGSFFLRWVCEPPNQKYRLISGHFFG